MRAPGLPWRRALVVGAGRTGVAVARFLSERGVEVTLTDARAAEALGEARAALGDRVAWELGGHRAGSFAEAELLVLSPGVPPLPEVEAARRAGAEVIGEIELASRFLEAPLLGITGTNGKSTVTALIGEMARATGRPTFVGGNLGTPLVQAIDTPAGGPDGIVVVELSSFQLETVDRTRPRGAAVLNLTPDHLDRYPDLDAYGLAKLRIATRMGAGDTLVLNAEDPLLAEISQRWFAARLGADATLDQVGISLGGPRLLGFGLDRAGRAEGAWLDGADLVLCLDGHEERYPQASLRLVGRHNLANALAALLVARASGLVSRAAASAGLERFRALPHRMQLVAERAGVRYFDDSKATNVDSVVAGLEGFPSPFVLIAGGRDKGGGYAQLRAALQRNACRALILIGEAAPLIEEAVGDVAPIQRADSMPDAVARAASLVSEGEAVVLSPACSSFDMFRNYEHRGQAFCAAVEGLPA